MNRCIQDLLSESFEWRSVKYLWPKARRNIDKNWKPRASYSCISDWRLDFCSQWVAFLPERTSSGWAGNWTVQLRLSPAWLHLLGYLYMKEKGKEGT